MFSDKIDMSSCYPSNVNYKMTSILFSEQTKVFTMAMSDLLLRVAIIEKNERGQEVELVRKTMQFKPQVRSWYSTRMNGVNFLLKTQTFLNLNDTFFKFVDDFVGSMCTNQRTSFWNQRIRSSKSIWIIFDGWRSQKRCLVGTRKNSWTLSPQRQCKYTKHFIIISSYSSFQLRLLSSQFKLCTYPQWESLALF